MAIVDGQKAVNRAEDRGGHKYFIAFGLLPSEDARCEWVLKSKTIGLLSRWVEDNLELYKVLNG